MKFDYTVTLIDTSLKVHWQGAKTHRSYNIIQIKCVCNDRSADALLLCDEFLTQLRDIIFLTNG